MSSTRQWRLAVWCGLLGATLLALGTVGPLAPADASCAGPQVHLKQDGVLVQPDRIGEGLDEKIVHSIGRDSDVLVLGSHLSFSCRDTYAYGCRPAPPYTPEPMLDAVVILEQDGHVWELAEVGEIGADLEAQVAVSLPKKAKPGPAVLKLVDPHQDGAAEVDLDLS